jgi:hypothetical protein
MILHKVFEKKWLLNVRAQNHLCKKRLKIPNGFSESNTEGQATPWPKQKEQMYKELRTKHYIEN